jgi:hypothetical protein
MYQQHPPNSTRKVRSQRAFGERTAVHTMAAAQYAPVVEESEEGRHTSWLTDHWKSLLDVDDAPMLRKRELVMNICVVQWMLSLVLLTNFRRSPVLLVLQPFFLAAAALGYYGAKQSKSLYIAAHCERRRGQTRAPSSLPSRHLAGEGCASC